MWCACSFIFLLFITIYLCVSRQDWARSVFWGNSQKDLHKCKRVTTAVAVRVGNTGIIDRPNGWRELVFFISNACVSIFFHTPWQLGILEEDKSSVLLKVALARLSTEMFSLWSVISWITTHKRKMLCGSLLWCSPLTATHSLQCSLRLGLGPILSEFIY